MKKLVTVLLALAMAFTMVFATAASAEDGYKDSITWVIGNDQDILDPQNNVSNSKVIPQYYNGLLGYDNDGNVVCKIAESYEASEDKMTWTFHLRQDVYFHSGRHCTAHDFEATFDRLLNTENPQRYTSNASFIDTAVATDDYTFVITLKEPKAFFLQAIAKQWAFVLNPEYIEKYGADLGKTAESVDGTGPFKCTQWDKGEVMKFEAFENYYEGAPLTHEIVMKIVPEQTSRAGRAGRHHRQQDRRQRLPPVPVQLRFRPCADEHSCCPSGYLLCHRPQCHLRIPVQRPGRNPD